MQRTRELDAIHRAMQLDIDECEIRFVVACQAQRLVGIGRGTQHIMTCEPQLSGQTNGDQGLVFDDQHSHWMFPKGLLISERAVLLEVPALRQMPRRCR